MIYDKMDDCFRTLNEKVEKAIEDSDLETLFKKLDEIEGPTLVCGVGGSSVVATYLAKVLREKKHIITDFISPRDLFYMDLAPYRNVIAVSYSGNNIGAEAIFHTDLNKYLFTGHPREDVNNLVYQMPKEMSYVSISATLVPLSLLFLYYCNDHDLLKEILDKEISSASNNNVYEVMSGYETQTAAVILESSFTESGMASCIVHDKYNFCHGRINHSRRTDSDLIFFKGNNELDEMLEENLPNHFKKIITIEKEYVDDVINDFYSALISMKLIRDIAQNKHKDISDMNELADNDVFYLFNGKMK
ncbi:MAG: hypothetical protein IJF87_00180 [Erysipelotrichaceae bacterium]|nr:hypothetical protein [Erysipelotrichaceae bacterium]